MEANAMYVPWNPPLVIHIQTSWQSALWRGVTKFISWPRILLCDTRSQHILVSFLSQYPLPMFLNPVSWIKFRNYLALSLHEGYLQITKSAVYAKSKFSTRHNPKLAIWIRCFGARWEHWEHQCLHNVLHSYSSFQNRDEGVENGWIRGVRLSF